MKRIIALFCALTICISGSIREITAEENLGWGLSKIYATFMGETVEVLDEVMEITSNIQEDLSFQFDFQGFGIPAAFNLVQMKDGEINDLITTGQTSFSISADLLKPEWPLYLRVMNSEEKRVLGVLELNIRVNKNKLLGEVPDDIGAEFGSGLKLDMSHLVPGMSLNALPFMIPVTVKTYASGKIRVGLGINSTDASFWNKAAKGELPEADMFEQLEDIFHNDPHSRDGISKPKSMGVVFLLSGWAEGNANSKEPWLGQLQLYIGTGFSVDAQYAIFTFNLSLSGGATGQFDFSLEYSEEDSKYHFSADHVLAGVKGALEVFAGIGCSLASVGVYGAGSIAYQQEMYPDPNVEHLILAGEVGLKAKLFGKVLACFKIVSGDHDFVFDENNKKKKAYLGMTLTSEEYKSLLLENSYGNTVGVLTEGGENPVWYGENADEPQLLASFEKDRDFAHLLASDIYPDNHIQIANTGSKAFPEISMIFLGNDASKTEGNRSQLYTGVYNPTKETVSTPVKILDDSYADFDPYLYENTSGPAYLVWQNAFEEVSAGMSFSEIASLTDICFSEHGTGTSWSNQQRVTNFAGSGRFAAGARVSSNINGKPVITYFTNDVNDPAGLNGIHEIYVAKKDGVEWKSEKVGEVEGSVTSLESACYGSETAVLISYEVSGEKHIRLMQYGKDIFNISGASNGRFIEAGNNYSFATWYKDGHIYQRSSNGQESMLTPEDMIIPDTPYEVYGHYGISGLMITSSSSIDSTADAFAYCSDDGGHHWYRSDLTKLNENAYVSHLSAAYTYEGDPVVMYSVQNYEVNVEETLNAAETNGDGGALFLLGSEDERFTDSRCDLYISGGRANQHVTIVDGRALDIESLRPGKSARFSLTVRNTGMYPVEHVSVMCDGQKVGELSQTLSQWETAEVIAEVTIPQNIDEIFERTFEISSREDGSPESRITLAADPGYFTVKTWHSFKFGEEQIRYQITNHGYLEKKAHIIVKDEARNVILEDRTVTAEVDWVYDSRYKSESGLFVKDGCQNVTIYILTEDETLESEGISLNRIKSIVPLQEIYGQDYDFLESHQLQTSRNSSSGTILTVCAIGAVAALYLILRKKKRTLNQ